MCNAIFRFYRRHARFSVKNVLRKNYDLNLQNASIIISTTGTSLSSYNAKSCSIYLLQFRASFVKLSRAKVANGEESHGSSTL